MDSETVEGAVLVETIVQRSLHDEVVERMRDMIIEGRLVAGTRINESELCRRLGVSRTPVREAIKTLSGEGLIELVRNKGAVVRRLGAEEVCDMLEAVALIERYAAEVGVVRASDAEIAAVIAMHQRMRAHYRAGERLPYYKLNQAIHAGIVALAHNETLKATHEALQMRLRRIRYLGHSKGAPWAGAMREHEAMIEALEKRDAAALVAAIDQHLGQTTVRVVPLIGDD